MLVVCVIDRLLLIVQEHYEEYFRNSNLKKILLWKFSFRKKEGKKCSGILIFSIIITFSYRQKSHDAQVAREKSSVYLNVGEICWHSIEKWKFLPSGSSENTVDFRNKAIKTVYMESSSLIDEDVSWQFLIFCNLSSSAAEEWRYLT